MSPLFELRHFWNFIIRGLPLGADTQRMGKKGGKKKAKGPTYYVEDVRCIPFGFRANDIIKTPLGLTGTVIGVKYENPDDQATGRLWVGTLQRRVPSFRDAPAPLVRKPTTPLYRRPVNNHFASWTVCALSAPSPRSPRACTTIQPKTPPHRG